MAAKVRRLYVAAGLNARLHVSVERDGKFSRFYEPSPASLRRVDRLVRNCAPFVALDGNRIGLVYEVSNPHPQPLSQGERGGRRRKNIVGIFPGKPGRA